RNRKGRNRASPRATSPEQRTRTQLGTGSRHTARPRLMMVRRNAARRLNSWFAARTAAGPPPRTTGRREERAPKRSCAANPAASAGVSQVNPDVAAAQSAEVKNTHVVAIRQMTSQDMAAAAE